MAIIPASFIEEVRSRVSLVSIVRQSVKLTQKGNDYWGCCPFHSEKTASFSVSDDKEFYHCFGCGAHGNVFDFVQHVLGYTFPEAVEYLASKAGLEVPKPTRQETEKEKKRTSLSDALELACTFFQEQLQSPIGREGLFYLQRRGVTQEILQRFRIGFAPQGNGLRDFLLKKGVEEAVFKEAGLVTRSKKDNNLYDYFRNRIMFPIMNKKGKVIAFGGRVLDNSDPKYLNSPESSLFSKGDNLYGLHLCGQEARKKKEILVVEGYMDVVGLACFGINRAVAPLGTALTERQIELLWQYVPEPLCCFDGDTAGQRAATRAAQRVLPLLKAGHSLSFLTLPNDLDPDEYVKEKGSASFENFIKTNHIPLFKHLWQSLVSQHPIDTPERKAQLEKEIQECTNKITDTSVQAFYQKEFKNALWDATSFHRNKQKNTRFFHDKKSGQLSVAHPSILPETPQTRMLMAYLLIFPEVGVDFLEELSEWETPSLKLGQRLKMLIQTLASDVEITTERLQNTLEERQEEKIYDELSSEIEMLKRRELSFQEVRDEIPLLLIEIRKKNIKKELQNLANLITQANEEEATLLWQKYQKLYEEEKNLNKGDSLPI